MLVIIYCAVLGLLIGSAINAIVWRLYVGRSWAHGRSMCPDCEHPLAARDLVPVASWVLLRGRCRYCRRRIHWQYPLVELLTAAAFTLSAVVLSPSTLFGYFSLAGWLVMLTLLIILAVYDARWMILPDKVMVPAIIIALGLVMTYAFLTRSSGMLAGPLLAAFLAGGFFLLLAVGTKGRGMGGGDVKLVFLMGLILGLKATAVALLVAFNVAAVVGVVLILTHRKKRRDYLPFGPYLIGATVLAYLYGRDIAGWYLAMIGLE